MKTLYAEVAALARQHADLIISVVGVVVYLGIVFVGSCLEDAALQAARDAQAERDLDRLLVIVVRGAEAVDVKRGNGGASSRPGVAGLSTDRRWWSGDVSTGADGADHGDVGAGQPDPQHHSGPARLSVADVEQAR